MAELVLGVGSSHSPMVSLGGLDWLEWGQRDHRHPMLFTLDGRNLSYEEQLAAVGPKFAERATIQQCQVGARRAVSAVSTIAAAVAEAALDVVIIIGDDQDEHLGADNLPPFLVYWGDTIVNRGVAAAGDVPALVRRYLPGYREPDGDKVYPVASELACHVIRTAIAGDFDVASSQRLPEPGRGMGHAFGFPLRRLVSSRVEVLPIMVNTYNPPSQPRASRCAAFGAVLRDAVDTFDRDARVGIIASGGLSHFLVHEELDQMVLEAFARRDLDAVTSIPELTFKAGTSEIKNWITVAAACLDLSFELVDYVPAYRTPAGTGVGLGFGLWQR